MKKRILSLAAISCLILSLTACGGGNASSSAASASASASASTSAVTSAETSAETTSTETTDSEMPTLEDYFESDIMQTAIGTTVEQYEAQGISAAVYAEGDELHYDFTMKDIETTEEDRATYADALKTSMEANAASFTDIAVQVKEAVANEVIVVVVSYYDGAGNEIYTQSFSSADAE